MYQRILQFAFAVLFVLPGLSSVSAQVSLPPVNLGTSSFMDGVGGPGILIQEVISTYNAPRFSDDKGNRAEFPEKVSSFSSLTHFAWLSEHKILGGYWGVEVLVPVAKVELTTVPGSTHTSSAIGDIITSPFILQWTGKTLLGRPFWSRLDLNVILPTGKYDREEVVNIGTRSWQFNPYYAFTWEITRKWEISSRFHYLWNSRRMGRAISARPGQAVHLNYSISYEMAKGLRIGPAGYYLTQVTDHKLDGTNLDIREKILGLGGALLWRSNRTFIRLQGYAETMARSHPKGNRISISINQIF